MTGEPLITIDNAASGEFVVVRVNYLGETSPKEFATAVLSAAGLAAGPKALLVVSSDRVLPAWAGMIIGSCIGDGREIVIETRSKLGCIVVAKQIGGVNKPGDSIPRPIRLSRRGLEAIKQ